MRPSTARVDTRPERSDLMLYAPGAVAEPVARASAVVGLIGVAAIHFAQVVTTIEATPYLGAAFVALTLACVGLAAGLVVNDGPALWVLVGAVNAAAIAGYAFTRLFSTFFDNQDVGKWSETLGLAALFVEVLLVALSLRQARAARRGYVPG